MMLATLMQPLPSPYGEDALGEVIRSTRYRVVIHPDKRCWDVQEWPNAAHAPLWRHFAYIRSQSGLAGLWSGLHGTCARHCWPELATLPAKFGGGG